jgi:hypothetical protein
MKRTFVSALAIMAMASVANADDIWLQAAGNAGAGGLVSIPSVGGSGQLEVWLDYDGGDTTTSNGTGWAIGFDGFGQTRNRDVDDGPAGNGLAHFSTTAFNDVATGNLGGLFPNDPTRGGASTFGSAVNGFGYVFALVDNEVGIGEGYFGGTGPVKADEIIISGDSETTLTDRAWLLGGSLAPTFVEVTDYNGAIGTEILLPLNNMSQGPNAPGAVDIEVLPEPASLALLMIGGLAAARRRR